MMLTTSFIPPPVHHHLSHAPPRPSPLGERSVNTTPRLFDFTMASQDRENKLKAPQRAYKPNPVLQTRDAATKRRRDMFFRRVQSGREDKKWEARGDQIQQLDFVAERKRWEAEKARQAPPEDDIIDEQVFEEEQLPEWSIYMSQPEQEMMEAEELAAQEEYDLQQLIALREQEEDVRSQHYGSDDDDYDSIFMECASSLEQQIQQQTLAHQQQTSQYQHDAEMEDIEMKE